MGNIERLIVLTVLLLTAVVLAVSLRRDGDSAQSEAPLEDARRTIEERVNGQERVDAAGEATLSSEMHAAGAVDSAATRAAPGARFPSLRDKRELRPTSLGDLMSYTARAGDTWQGLALRFYGDAQYESVLRAANEGLAVPPAGQELLVPMYDAAEVAAARPPLQPVLDAGTVHNAAGTAKAPGAPGSPEAPGARIHEVKPGETLSSISKAQLGSAARWKEIAALNADILANPDQLKVGMRLRLP